MLPCVEILTGNVTKTQKRKGRLRLGWPDNIDLLVTMSPRSDQWTQFSKQNSGPSTFTVTLSSLPPLGLSLTRVIILVIMLTQTIKQLLKSKVPSFYFPDKEINVLPWSQTFISIQNF